MPKFWYRLRGVHDATIGPTGHHLGHAGHTLEKAPTGEERLAVECASCTQFLHPSDWSLRPADVDRTYDEIQAELEQAERAKVLSPDIAQLVAQVVAQFSSQRVAVPTAPAYDEAALVATVTAAVQAELAKSVAAAAAVADSAPVPA